MMTISSSSRPLTSTIAICGSCSNRLTITSLTKRLVAEKSPPFTLTKKAGMSVALAFITFGLRMSGRDGMALSIFSFASMNR